MSEIDPFAAAGTVVAAFVAGSGIFYALGRNSTQAKLKQQLERKSRELRDLSTKVGSLNAALDEARGRVLDLEQGRVPSPAPDQANQLIQTLLRNEDDVWLTEPLLKPHGHDDRVASLRTKIISVANLKGGVGKTTTTANLAAYFDTVLGKRVLVIDADYQGSLSSVLNRMAQTEKTATTTARWLEGVADVDDEVTRLDRVSDAMPKTRYVSAFYDLSNIETRLMVQWLLQSSLRQTDGPDLRYALSRILHSAAIQARFDVILIDCPPRLSTATINALCASTHLLVPSVPDNSSLEAVSNFLKMYRRVTARLNHNIHFLGVAPTLTAGTSLNDDEINNLEKMRNRVRLYSGGDAPYIFNSHIPRNVPIARLAGAGIALLRGPAATKRVFKNFGAEVAERLGPQASYMAVAAE